MNYEVQLVTDVLGAGTEDGTVCKFAEAIGAIVVTLNGQDYLRILARRAEEHPRRFRRAGCLFLNCRRHELANKRLKLFHAFWQFELAHCSEQTTDPRLIIEIRPDKLIVYR